MAHALKNDWFRRDSIEDTLKEVIRAFDKDYLARVSLGSFTRDLLKEIRFISVYAPDEFGTVQTYVHEHAQELYSFAKSL